MKTEALDMPLATRREVFAWFTGGREAQTARARTGWGRFRRPADCKSAIQQIENLRYASVVKTFSTFRERFGGRAPLCEWMNMKTMPTICRGPRAGRSYWLRVCSSDPKKAINHAGRGSSELHSETPGTS
jgi:hypothetical protein